MFHHLSDRENLLATCFFFLKKEKGKKETRIRFCDFSPSWCFLLCDAKVAIWIGLVLPGSEPLIFFFIFNLSNSHYHQDVVFSQNSLYISKGCWLWKLDIAPRAALHKRVLGKVLNA